MQILVLTRAKESLSKDLGGAYLQVYTWNPPETTLAPKRDWAWLGGMAVEGKASLVSWSENSIWELSRN